MIYNIVVLADIHCGVIDPTYQYDNLELVNIFIKKYSNIDLLVINGDYFDAILSMNSKPAILAIQWFHRLIKELKENNVKKVRVVKGTQDHDNMQLEVFRELEDNNGFFKIFNTCTFEETLPNLKAIYCPDENINAKEYMEIYSNQILQYPNIGFFHGSFDVVLPNIVVQLSEETSAKNIIYEYDLWSKIITGPMISGHWHNHMEYGSLIYVGSFDRWVFGEDEDKGFAFIRFDTTTNEYYYKQIVNEFANKYITFNIDTHIYSSIEEYSFVINKILEVLDNKDDIVETKIRIVINVTDDKTINDEFITSVKQYFANNRLVKITMKNKLKRKKKEEEVKKNKESSEKYGFILNNKLTEAEIIRQFIKESKDKEIDIAIIDRYISKYIKS